LLASLEVTLSAGVHLVALLSATTAGNGALSRLSFTRHWRSRVS